MAIDREDSHTHEIGAALEALHARLTTGGHANTPSLAGLDAEELLRVMRLQERLVQLEQARMADEEQPTDSVELLSSAPLTDSTQADWERDRPTPQPSAGSINGSSNCANTDVFPSLGGGVGGAASRGLIGRFEVLRVLGRGGQGLMLLANDPVLGRKVALKVPWSETLITPQLRRRFLREARAVARLTHPHIVPVYEVGELGPICFIASAFVEGPSLAEWLASHRGMLSPRQAAAILAELADAVQYAHDQGVLHRDLKPANVILEPRGATMLASAGTPWVAKLTDFGLAKIVDLAADETRSGALIGTPAYMSPEQAKADHAQVGPASDVYSLGAILYELLTGSAPFRADSEAETLRCVIMEPATSTRRLRLDVPADLDAICLKCLEKAPAARYASAANLVADLRRFLAGEPTIARPLSTVARATRWAGRNRRVAALLGLVAMLLLGMTGISTVAALRINDARRVADENAALAEQRASEERAARTESERLNAALQKNVADLRDQKYPLQYQVAFESLIHGDARPARRLLAEHDSPRDRADFEIVYLRRQVECQPVQLLTDQGRLYDVTFTRDGKFLLAGDDKGTLWIWDAVTLQLKKQIAAHRECLNQITMSPDGRLAATIGCDKLVKLWDTSNWELVGELHGHSLPIGSCQFSPDGGLLATASLRQWPDPYAPGEYFLWDVAKRESVSQWRSATDLTNSLAFVDDGRALLAATLDGQFLKWDLTAQPPAAIEVKLPEELTSRAAGPYEFTALRVSGDGTHLLYVARQAGIEHCVTTDLATGNFSGVGQLGDVWGRTPVALSHDGARLAAGNTLNQMRLIHMAMGVDELGIRGKGRALGVGFSPDGYTLAIGTDIGDVWLYPLSAFGNETRVRCPLKHWARRWLSPDGARTYFLDAQHHIGVCDTLSGELLRTDLADLDVLDVHGISPDERWASIEFAQEGREYAAVAELGGARRLHVTGARYFRPQLSDDGKWFAVVTNDGLRIGDVENGYTLREFRLPDEIPLQHMWRSLAISHDGRYVLVPANHCQVVDLARETTRDFNDAGEHLRVSPCGRYALSLMGRRIKQYTVPTGEIVREYLVTATVQDAVFSPDGRLLAAACEDGKLRLYDVGTGQMLCALALSEMILRGCEFSRDGHTLTAWTFKRDTAYTDVFTIRMPGIEADPHTHSAMK